MKLIEWRESGKCPAGYNISVLEDVVTIIVPLAWIDDENADFAIEIMGLIGNVEYSEKAPLEGSMIEMYQSIIGSIICAGSNEIQRNIIAWVGCNLPRLKGI